MINKKTIFQFNFKKLFWCFLLLAAALVVTVSIFPNNDAVPINNEGTHSFNDGWTLESSREEIKLPYVVDTAANETVTISKVLPDVFQQSNPTLSFHSSLQTVRVEVAGRVIYTYCAEPDAYLDVQPPPAWHVIRLSPDMAGKTIRMIYNSPYDNFSGVLNDVELGTKYANVTSFVGTRLFSMVLCIIIFTFGLFAITIYLFAHNQIADFNQLLYLGVAALLVSLWSVCETKAMQVFVGNVQAIMFVTFLSIMLFPIAFLLFFREGLTGKMRTLYNILIGVFSLYFGVTFLLQICNIINFNDFFFVFLILIAVMLALILSSLIIAHRKQKTLQTRLTLTSVSILLIFVLADMYRYLFQKLFLTSFSDTAVFTRVGILVMLFILGYSSIRQMLVYYSESAKMGVYKTLSQTDSMSGLKNRAYLTEIYPVVFKDAARRQKPVSVIMVDIDNFKNYNDHYGHSAGDNVIREVAEVLRTQAEALSGSAIRYGGEEFLLILPYQEQSAARAAAEKIKENLDAKKIEHAFSDTAPVVTVSQGIYTALPSPDETLEQFIDCSDWAMYAVKKNKKNGYVVYNADLHKGTAGERLIY